MRRVRITIVLAAFGLGAIFSSGIAGRFGVRQSGEGFGVGDWLVLCEYGYSDDGDRLRYAIIRTFPKNSTAEQRLLDPRRASDFLGWPLIRDANGHMIPVGTDGNVYFFDGDICKKMRVSMDEHTDPGPLGNAKTLDEMWTYLQRFQVD